ncbi:hypothetical protein V6N12_000001 [Hibiscus sabdariffa]|uniref:Uncharacterized protein n=2 Tax=Hibiscus sabdariffa TaxID=183260 RepID=A0ABR1ZB61_9ROSI
MKMSLLLEKPMLLDQLWEKIVMLGLFKKTLLLMGQLWEKIMMLGMFMKTLMLLGKMWEKIMLLGQLWEKSMMGSVNADSNDITTDTTESDEESNRKEIIVEDEGSDIDYIESDDPDNYEIDSEWEVCVKKDKKLFFDEKGEVPGIELGMIFESPKQFKEALGA